MAQDWSLAYKAGNPWKQENKGALGAPLSGLESFPFKKENTSTVVDRAVSAGVSERTQQYAEKILKTDNDLAKKVRDGEIKLKKAVEQLNPPKPKKEEVSLSASKIETELGEDGNGSEPEINWRDEFMAQEKRMQELETMNESFAATDQGAEIKKLAEQKKLLEDHLNGTINTKNEAVKTATYQTKLLKEIREALGVEKNSEILSKLTELKGAK